MAPLNCSAGDTATFAPDKQGGSLEEQAGTPHKKEREMNLETP